VDFVFQALFFFNHYACDLITEQATKNHNFVELQLATTRNLTSSIITDWFCGGINLQIEHHLFPTLPRHNLSTVSTYVKQFCAKYGLIYQCKDLIPGYTNVLTQLANVAYSLHKRKF